MLRLDIWSQAVKHCSVCIINLFYHALGIVVVFCENIMLSGIISLIEKEWLQFPHPIIDYDDS